MAIPVLVAAESETEFHALVRCHEPEPLVEAMGVRSCLVSGQLYQAAAAAAGLLDSPAHTARPGKRVR